MYRRDKQARLLTNGIIGVSTDTTLGDEHWNDVTLLLDGSSLTDDLSTAGNDTTDEGAAIVSVTGPYGGTQDVLDFDRTGSTTTTGKFIKTGVTDDFKFGTSPFTIEMWLKPDTLDTSSQSVSLGCICEYDTTVNIVGAWFALHQVNGEVRFYIDNGDTNLTTTNSGLSTSDWSHVAIVRDAANTLTIYVDGVSKAVSSAGAFSHNLSDANSRQLYIGKQPTQLRHYDGKIADLRITKGVARYTKNFKPPVKSFPAQPLGLTVPVAGDDFWDDVTLLLDGSSTTDLSIAGNVLTNYGATTPSVTGPYGSTQNVLDFDKTGATLTTGNYLETGVTADFKFGTSPFTIEMWLKPDTTDTSSQTNSYAAILEYDQVAATTGAWFALHQENGEVVFFTNNGNTSVATTSSGLSTSAWFHVAIVRDVGNTLTIYVNGVSKGSGAFSHNMSDAVDRNLFIGKQYNVTRHYDGQIADLRITKGVARYTQNFTPPTASFLTKAPSTTTTGRRGVGSVPIALTVDTFATLSATNNAGVTLSNANLTALSGTNSGRRAVADSGISSGAYYWEVLSQNQNAGLFAGIVNTSNPTNTNSFIGNNSGSHGWWSFSSTSDKYNGGNNDGTLLPGLPAAAVGDIIRVRFDSGTNTLDVAKNNGAWFTISSSVASGTWYPVFGEGSGSNTSKVTFNFGQDHTFAGNKPELATPFTDANGLGEFYYEPPAGFVGLYTTTANPLRTRGYIGAAPDAVAGDEYWNDVSLLLDGSTTSLTTDASSAGNDPTNSNVTSTTATITGWSEASDVFEFNSSTDSLTLPSNFAPDFGTDDFTIELWYRTDLTTGSNYVIFDTRGDGVVAPGTDGWRLGRTNQTVVLADNSNFYITTGNVITSTSTWYHIAMVRSGATVTIYVDGSSAGSFNATTAGKNFDTGTPLTIGRKPFESSGVLAHDGQMAHIRFTQGVARYTAAFTPPTESFLTNAPQRPAGMLSLYDRYVDTLA